MPTNIEINTLPPQWSSAYDDIIVLFDFKNYSITAVNEQTVGSIGTGFAEVSIYGTFDVTPLLNQYVYIDSGIYMGLHRIISAGTDTVVINAAYIGNQSTGNIKHLRIPTFQLFKGFKPGEQFEVELSYALVTQFVPIFNSDYQIEINLKALLQLIFTITPPSINTDYDFSVFNAYRLVWDTDNETEIRYVLNSSIPTDELNSNYVGSNSHLNNVDKPLLWGCGISFMTVFDNGFPKLQIFGSGTPVSAGFSAGFVMTAFKQGFNI